MPSTAALRAAKAVANSGKPKPGQTTINYWAEIIDREAGIADFLAACRAIDAVETKVGEISPKRFLAARELAKAAIAKFADDEN